MSRTKDAWYGNHTGLFFVKDQASILPRWCWGGLSSLSNAGVSATSSPDAEPPVITINGENPAHIHVGDTYADLGATITGPAADTNLGIRTFLNGTLVSNIILDTTQVATFTIDYIATDTAGLTATSTRAVLIEANAIPSRHPRYFSGNTRSVISLRLNDHRNLPSIARPRRHRYPSQILPAGILGARANAPGAIRSAAQKGDKIPSRTSRQFAAVQQVGGYRRVTGRSGGVFSTAALDPIRNWRNAK